MTATLRIARNAALVGYLDVRAQYTWKSWLFGWITRVTAQVLFFTAIGLLVGGHDLVLFAFVGNVTARAAQAPLGTGPDTAWERGLGTLPLLVAAPRSMLPVFGGRSAFYIVQGLVEASLIFVILAPFVGFSGQWWWLPAGLAVVSLGAYGLGLFLAAIAIRRLRIGNILFNLVFYTLITIGGVNVATSVFPTWVQRTADLLPLYHGLLGLRELLATGPSSGAFGQLGLELLVGAAWFLIALVGFRLFAEGGRRDGTIDLEE
ncbi:ABC-2 type transporter [bacterium BMS3Abin02]|nr:ABC-2 type transporter [bacterium BMS3Abin02]GBE21494.1 ABC-2 type transporter [bacterium BMS3Bbin01]